jgi:hypothetical protein
MLACSAPLELADWTIPVPDGARIIEYAHVAVEDRARRIELVEDLVIPEGEEPFYRLTDVDADASGNIYAFDAGNRNIVTFDAAGNYLRTFGRPGQGPGEIGRGGSIAIVDTDLVHVSQNRMNVWAPDGEVLESRNLVFTRSLAPIAGTDAGILLGSHTQVDDEGARYRHVVRLSTDGELEVEYVKLLEPGPVSFTRQTDTIMVGTSVGVPGPVPTFAASRQAEIYTVAGDEYQVLAFAPDGTVRWALRTTMRRPVLTDARIDEALQRLAEVRTPAGMLDPRPQRSEVDWPAALPALAGRPSTHSFTAPLRVDGHGHLYVFPFIPDDWDRQERPVDVYSPAGERLFSGMMAITRWNAARDQFVYAVGTDPVTEEYQVIRYRLVEPFD